MAGGELGAEHERLRSDALRAFKETRKMGGDDFALAFLEQLDEELTVRCMRTYDALVDLCRNPTKTL
jgi:hypothetical protein